MPFSAVTINNELVLEGESHSIMHDEFQGRYTHLMYITLGRKKTLCIAYAFKITDNDIHTFALMWGGCVMGHRRGSPPKTALRSTAVARLSKCPAHTLVSSEEFGAHLETGKAFYRKALFVKLVRLYGVKGARIDRL